MKYLVFTNWLRHFRFITSLWPPCCFSNKEICDTEFCGNFVVLAVTFLLLAMPSLWISEPCTLESTVSGEVDRSGGVPMSIIGGTQPWFGGPTCSVLALPHLIGNMPLDQSILDRVLSDVFVSLAHEQMKQSLMNLNTMKCSLCAA